MTATDLRDQWAKRAEVELTGRTIVAVRYLTDKEMENLGWYDSALVMFLDDGSYVFPSQDDEGNGAGALFHSSDDLPVIPVI